MSKSCKSPGCAGQGINVETDEETCLLCGKQLHDAARDLLNSLLGNKGMDGLFGK